MNYRRIGELFREFSEKLEEQHTYYLDSIIGFSIVHDRVVEIQERAKKILGDDELAKDEFLDTCSVLYKELSGRDLQPVSLTPLMKQGLVKARTSEGGQNTLILGANCIVALYSYWEEYLRAEIGIAKGVLERGALGSDESREVLKKHVVSDIWGDLRHLRNSIVHHNSIAYSKIKHCKIVKCFKAGDKVELDFNKMRTIFLLLADFRNELHRMSLPSLRGIQIPSQSGNMASDGIC